MTEYYLRDYSEIATAPANAPWWSMTFDLVVKLGLVIGLIYLTMWALRTYVLATLLGIIPGTFVYVNLGAAVGRLDSLTGALSMNTLVALSLLGLLALVPIFVRGRSSQPTPRT